MGNAANGRNVPLLTVAALRRNVSYWVPATSRLTNTKVNIIAVRRNTAPTIHAVGVEYISATAPATTSPIAAPSCCMSERSDSIVDL